jgi:hypothetical protein
MTEMLRYNKGKPRYSIFPPTLHQLFIVRQVKATRFLQAVVGVMDFGSKKYELHNWKKSGSWHKCADSAMRHMIAFREGEMDDPESGLPHLHHYATNLAFLFEFHIYESGEDDRWKGYEQPRIIQGEGDQDVLTTSFLCFLSWLDGGEMMWLETAILSLAAHLEMSDEH